MKKYVITIIVVVVVFLLLFGSYYIYSNTSFQNNTDNLKAKADKEIEYLNSTIISIMNKFNNINYANYKIVEKDVTSKSQNQSNSSTQGGGQSQESGTEKSQNSSETITNIDIDYSSVLVNPNKKIDWDYIKKEVEMLYSTWTTVLIDLNSLNVNKDNILKFSTTLNDITQALEKKDKKLSLTKLSDLYGLLVSYMNDYNADKKMTYIFDTKANILHSYALAEYDDKWPEMKDYIKRAQNAYGNIMNSEFQNANNSNTINKGYILLNEIDKSVDKKDKNIFYINYKNLMQELEVAGK